MNRRAFSLIDVIVALGILAIPVGIVLSLFSENVTGARFNQERMVTQTVLNDLACYLSGQEQSKLSELATGDRAGMNNLLEGRIAGLPAALRDRYRRQVRHLFDALSFALEEEVGGIRGMARLTLTARLTNGTPVALVWLLRPGARVDTRIPRPNQRGS